MLGLAIAVAGMAWLTRLPVHGRYLPDLLAGLFPLALGMGLVFVPITLLATSGVDGDDAGLASGLFNTSQQVGGALGLAVLSTLAANRTSNLLSGGHESHAAATVAGFHLAFLAGAILMALAVVLIATALRPRHLAHVAIDAPMLPIAQEPAAA
jgi:hypothetical protein